MNTTSDNKQGLFLLGLTLAVGLIIAMFILSSALTKVKSKDEFITVKGYVEKNIKSDLGVWTGTVTARSSDLINGYSKLQSDVLKLTVYLEKKGVDKNKISIGPINTQKKFKWANGSYSDEVTAYTLDQSITIESKDVNMVYQISNEATSLIQEGIEIASKQPKFFFTKINDLKIEMLGESTKDAKTRAVNIAKNSGSTVGNLKSAYQGVFQITPVNSTEVSDYGEYDLSSIDKTIKAVVTIDFFVK